MFMTAEYRGRAEPVLTHRSGSNRNEPIQEARMATSPVCIVEGCGKGGKLVKGWCDAHYRRWRRHGDPQGGRIGHGEPTKWLLAHVQHDGDDCLRWPFGVSEFGYAKIARNGRWTNASRVMCATANGEPPSKQHQACHSCGKGHEACINPKHLYWGLPVENMADQVIHGTRAQGERQGGSKLKEADVVEIRRLAGVIPQIEIAARFDLSKQQVSKIIRRDRWGWLA